MIFDCNYINDKGGNQQIKHQQFFDTQQAKTIGGIGGAGNNGDSGQKSTIPDRSGKMQSLRAIIDCGATSIFIYRHRGFSSDSEYHIRRHTSSPSP